MRAPALLAGGLLAVLASTPAHAVDAELGADVDVAFAYGDTLKAPGGGLTLRLGLGPNPIKLGPSAFSLLGEVTASGWRFPDVEEGPTDLIRGTAGVRTIFTLVWLRKPSDKGGRGRGIRLDLPIAAHVGAGSLDQGMTWTPTADANLGLAVGLLPLQVGLHVGAGGVAASQDVQALQGAAWVNVGVDVGAVF